MGGLFFVRVAIKLVSVMACLITFPKVNRSELLKSHIRCVENKGGTSQMEVEKLRQEVESRMRNGETFSLTEIRKIMKSTGLSYVQVIQRAKKLKKDTEEAKAEAERNGEVFDKEAYIQSRMRG